MNLIQVEVMDPEEAAARLALKQAENELAERARLAASNRKRGLAVPVVGNKLYVRTAKGIKRRSRAGVTFHEERSTEVTVVEDEFGSGENEVSVHGAEMILGDDALNVNAPSATDSELTAARKELEAARSEMAAQSAEIARLRAARMNAPESKDGRPTRLMAADAARRGKEVIES